MASATEEPASRPQIDIRDLTRKLGLAAIIGIINEASTEFIPAQILNNPAVFPSPQTRAVLQFTEDLGRTTPCTRTPGSA